MKVLLFSSKFPPQIGGVEEVTKNLAINLSKYCEISVITTLNFRSEKLSFLQKLVKGFKVSKQEYFENVKVSEVFISLPRSFFGLFSFPYRFLISVFTIRKIIKKIKPDVINAHFLDDSLLYFYFSTLRFKNKIILDIHGNEIHIFSKNKFYKYFFSKIIKKASKIVVHSEYMKESVIKTYPFSKNIIVIENAIELKKFKTLFNPTKDYYLFVGRLDYKKGVDILIKAYKKVEAKLSRKLLIIGGSAGEKKHGSLNVETLKNLAKNSNIEFLGKIPNEIVLKKYFPNAYFSIFPSRYEPFGIVALESLASGTPFIASSGGFKEIAKKTKGGVVFKEGAVSSLSNLLLKLDKDTKLREKLSKQGLNNISDYDMKKFIKN